MNKIIVEGGRIFYYLDKFDYEIYDIQTVSWLNFFNENGCLTRTDLPLFTAEALRKNELIFRFKFQYFLTVKGKHIKNAWKKYKCRQQEEDGGYRLYYNPSEHR